MTKEIYLVIGIIIFATLGIIFYLLIPQSNAEDIYFLTSSTGSEYIELCRDTAISGDTSMLCNLSSSKKYLRTEIFVKPVSPLLIGIKFNPINGTDNTYSFRHSTNGQADVTAVLRGNASFSSGNIGNLQGGLTIVRCFNILSEQKVCSFVQSVSKNQANTVMDRSEGSLFWGNTVQSINTIEVFRINGTGTFTADSNFVVYGHD